MLLLKYFFSFAGGFVCTFSWTILRFISAKEIVMPFNLMQMAFEQGVYEAIFVIFAYMVVGIGIQLISLVDIFNVLFNGKTADIRLKNKK